MRGERHEHNAKNTRIERETILHYFRFVLSLNPGIVHNIESLLCTVQLRDISGAGTRIRREKRSVISTQDLEQTWETDNEKSDQGETGMAQQEQDLEKKIKKEIDKLKFYLEEGDELLEDCDYSEIALTCKRTDEIQDRLNDLMSTLQELKIDRGISTQREVR